MSTKDLDFLFGVHERAQSLMEQKQKLSKELAAERAQAKGLRKICYAMCAVIFAMAAVIWRLA